MQSYTLVSFLRSQQKAMPPANFLESPYLTMPHLVEIFDAPFAADRPNTYSANQQFPTRRAADLVRDFVLFEAELSKMYKAQLQLDLTAGCLGFSTNLFYVFLIIKFDNAIALWVTHRICKTGSSRILCKCRSQKA